ncbi:hypothetical protein KUTeg_012394 [Tegillarca granosa]|uniref:Chitin-binding type-2 domain-containing protein n=1 Tax=Tegillarca granosa TaxID=220873 RepID=A0ABQ9EZL3_TEGGR|nr:hypothetical protein KUTeg_012394 [Tegillarca granosa]
MDKIIHRKTTGIYRPTTPTSPTDGTDPCKPNKHNQMLSVPYDCHSFYVCSFGVTYKFECPGDLVFYPNKSACDNNDVFIYWYAVSYLIA